MSYDNAMRRQVFSLPDLIDQQYNDLEPKTRKILDTPQIFSIQRIILTGCGDSYAAGMAAKHAFEMLTGIPTDVVSAIELSRFYAQKQLGFAPYNPLVIAVSNSGAVARVGEAVQRANQFGAFTLGITSELNSMLGQSAQKVLKLDIPKFENAPGVRTYMVSVMALLLMAIRIGEVRSVYSMDQAMAYRYDLCSQGKKLAELLPEMDKKCLDLSQKWSGMEAFDFIGAGFDYAAAWYGHAKIFEATGKYSMHVDSEEWLHLNFFMRNINKIGTFMFANSENPALSRDIEVAEFCVRLKRPFAIVYDGDEKDFHVAAEYIKTPKTEYPISIPLTQFAPLAIISGYIAAMIGEEYGRGCINEWEFCKGGMAVNSSRIIIKE